MRISHLDEGVGRIIKGVNTTIDVGVDQTSIEASKFGNKVDKDGKPPTLSSKVKGASTNVAFNLGLTEGYKLQLERDKELLVLHIKNTETGKRTEVRGKPGYETNYDPNDDLHQLLDTIGKSANISDLMNGEVVGINPGHPDGAKAKAATTKAYNEERFTALEWACIEGGHELPERPQRKISAIMEQLVAYELSEALGELDPSTEIYVDMDGVLADFFGEWAKVMGKKSFRDIEDPASAIKKIKTVEDFWLNLPVLPQAKELLSLIKRVKGKYKICTSPLADDPRSEPHKREWVKKNLSFFLPEEVIVTHNKPQFAKNKNGTPNILIDDYGVNIRAWEAAGGIGFKYKDHKFERTASAIKKALAPNTTQNEAFDTDVEWIKGAAPQGASVFAAKVDDAYIEITYKPMNKGVYISFTRGARMSVTGEGGQNKIFGAVINHIKKWVDANKPQEIYFSAFKPNTGAFGTQDTTRSSLYRKMVQRFASQNGYDYDVEDTGNEDTFILKRKETDTQTNEALDQPYPVRWTTKDDDEWEGKAKTEAGDSIQIMITQGFNNHKWEVDFYVGGSMQVTGKGDQFRVFATVVSAVKKWWAWLSKSKQPVEAIIFSAFKGNKSAKGSTGRSSLYNRFATQFARSIGFTVSTVDRADNVKFVLTNPNYKDQQTENFADGKKKGKSRPGRVKRSGASCNGSVTDLRKRAKNASGEKAKMLHWCANMKSGRKKK